MTESHANLIQSIYDERSTKYDDSFHGLLADDYIRFADPKEGEYVLDLACGTGLVTIPAAQRVGNAGHVVGIDISDGMLDVGRRKAEKQGLDVPFIQHDISDLNGLELLPVGSQGFDLITCAAALVLLPDPPGAIRHWTTLLKPGGRLVIDVAAKDVNVPSRLFSRIGEQLGKTLQWDQSWVQSEESLAKLLRDSGLMVESVFMTKTYQVREYTVQKASETFEQAVASPMYRNFGEPSVREEARRLFVEVFKEEAGAEGVLLDEAKMYMAVGYKP
ncbi:S-adenosyl-L-methionine-dependent methyltransferase [Aspergillus steynii IBT 23096]|uniref:S-adenosyl-L-methionine-dependent methyltransferase n=1 Tax=Aspergillus steynii IBT 23096 TaxID=1392250 RepID=A0A2I2G175_9EURO|nr:S-adenosyl-L-methionine-dependent methyltransferase [Aspergillus steynii IBT 23096]PLB46630.1 S-adenosyl-L-methionine-dependent methyltransferase [Aspergillus steynii IBT 23096]